MRRRNGMVVLLCFVFAVVALFTTQMLLLAQTFRDLPDATEWYAKDGFQLTKRQLLKLDEAAETYSYTATVQADLTVPFMEQTRTVDLSYTNAGLAGVCNINLIEGNWFASEETDKIVVSSRLAVALFKHNAIVGEVLKLGDREVTVSGVYQNREGLLSEASGNGNEVVYAAYGDAAMPPTTYLYIKNIANDLNGFTQKTADELMSQVGTFLQPDYSKNYGETRALLEETKQIVLFFWSILLSIPLIFGIIRSVRQFIKLKRKGEQSTLLKILLPIFGIIALLCLYWLVRFTPFIPNAYLPPDNIFDCSYYFQVWAENRQRRHAVGEVGFYGNLAELSFHLSAALMLVNLLLSGITALWVRGIVRGKQKIGDSDY